MANSTVSILETLQAAWLVLSPNGHSLAVVSPFHSEGMVAPVYSQRGDAEAAAAQYKEAGRFQVYPMPPLVEVARLLAQQGFAGMLVDEKLPLYFMMPRAVPGGEPSEQGKGSEGATVPATPPLVSIPQGESWLIVDEQGPTGLMQGEVTTWRNYPAFDRLSIIWLFDETLPFVGYEEDMPLWEVHFDGAARPVADTGMLLEPSAEVQGAFSLFSDSYAAEWYWANHVGANVASHATEGEEAEEVGIAVAEEEIPALLEARAMPGLATILNPARHRFFQGFFRRAEEDWYLITINGVWLVEAPFRCTPVARRRFVSGG